MPISLSFTITSAIAFIGLAYVSRELTLNMFAARRGNGLALEVAWMIAVLINALSITNAIELIVGAGVLLHVSMIGYLLALNPIIKLTAAVLVVRSMRKQIAIYQQRHVHKE